MEPMLEAHMSNVRARELTAAQRIRDRNCHK